MRTDKNVVHAVFWPSGLDPRPPPEKNPGSAHVRRTYTLIYWDLQCAFRMKTENDKAELLFMRVLSSTFPGWVVTWFLLGYTVRMFEYTVRTFWSNISRFLYFFSSLPRKLYTIFQPTFSPIKCYQNSIYKLLTLSTNSVTNVVRTAYFQIQARSSPLKILWQSLYSK